MEKEIKMKIILNLELENNRFKDNLIENKGNALEHKKFLDMYLLKNGNKNNNIYKNNDVYNHNNLLTKMKKIKWLITIIIIYYY